MSRKPSPSWAGSNRPQAFASASYTLTGDTDLVVEDVSTGDVLVGGRVLLVDCGGASRNLDLPAEADMVGAELVIRNTSDGAGENLTVRDDSEATTHLVLTPGQTGHLFCDGTSWYGALFVEPTSGAFSGVDALTWDVNQDAVAATDEDPSLRLWGGDGVAAPNNDVVRSYFTQDSTAELVYFQTERSRNAGAYARVPPELGIGREGETTASLDSILSFNAATNAGAARQYQATYLGQENEFRLAGPAGSRTVVEGPFSVRTAAGDANPVGGFTAGGALEFGAGGTTAVDVVLTRGAANRLALAAGDTFRTIGSIETLQDVAGGTALVVGGRAADASSTGAAVTNNAAEAASATITIPANTLTQGKTCKIRAGFRATATNAADTLTARLRLGGLAGTVLVATGAVDVADGDVVVVDFELTAEAAPGAAVNVVGCGMHSEPAAEGGAMISDYLVPTAVATNGNLDLVASLHWSAASTADSAICEYLRVVYE